ncbi:MAG: S-layer homology domain-containing protein [Thermoanaerobacteraceae bacterium]|nr:S-layer homology domain-containing protein [Thermoanaerobacteraceae bacterium]
MRRIGILLLAFTLLFPAICGVYAAPADREVYQGFQGFKYVLNSVMFEDKVADWAYRDAVRVTALSLLKGVGDGKFHPDRILSREEAIGVALRLAGVEEDAQKRFDQKTAGLYSDIVNASTWAVGYIFTAADDGYIPQGDIYSEDWKAAASREEFASCIGRALGYAPAYGIDQRLVLSFDDSKSFNVDYIPFIEPVLKEGIMVGKSNGTFAPKSSITRSEVAVILGRILDKYPEKFAITRVKATVSDIEYNSVDYIMRKADSSLFVISTDNEHGIVVLDNGKVKDSLKLYQLADIYMKDRVPYFIEVAGSDNLNPRVQEGEVISTGKDTVNIQVGSNVNSYNITPYTVITVDGRKASFDEIIPGQFVSFTSNSTNLLQLSIDGGVENPGYTESGKFYYTGSVVVIDSGYVTIRDEEGNTKSFILPSYVNIKAKPGDIVKVYLDNEGRVYSMEKVAGNMEYAYLYRGRLSSVVANKVQIDDTLKFDNFRWTDETSLNFQVSDNVKLYDTGVEQENLKNYIGSYVYLITRMEYGEEKVYRIIAENGHMKEYVENIDSVDSVAGSFSLPDTDVRISKGSVILKDGKMVTIDNLEKDQTVLALLDRMGSNNEASLVMVLDSQPPVRIVRGKIDTINSTTFDADYIYEIDGNEWRRVRNAGSLYVNNDTYILDCLDDTKTISSDKFLNDRYERHPVYEGEYFYAVMDGEEVVGMVIFDYNNSEDIRFVTARFDTMDNNGLANLTSILEYSSFTEKWTPGPSHGYVWTQDALVIKGNRISSMDYMKKGTPLYILLDDRLNGLLIVEGDE